MEAVFKNIFKNVNIHFFMHSGIVLFSEKETKRKKKLYKGPFKYYVIKRVGGGVGQMIMQ